MTDLASPPEPDPADVELAIRAAARARYLYRWPDASERASRYAAEMAGDPMYRAEMNAALAALVAAGRLAPRASSTADVIAEAQPLLQQCGPCDAGLPMNCTCPIYDYRPVMARLVAEVERLRAMTA